MYSYEFDIFFLYDFSYFSYFEIFDFFDYLFFSFYWYPRSKDIYILYYMVVGFFILFIVSEYFFEISMSKSSAMEIGERIHMNIFIVYGS